MLKVVEVFSGIGSQSKALQNLNIDYEISNTIEWDITAIYAYDIIHNGPQDLSKYDDVSKEQILKKLSKYQLSRDGKDPLTYTQLARYKKEVLVAIYEAIVRTNNLVSVTEVKAEMLPKNIDILTYSFPCQDLSVSGYFHGDKGGIGRDANNSSSMLWEIERILMEMIEDNIQLPRFLLMENVTNIRSKRHLVNFKVWKKFLSQEGNYINKVYNLCAKDFGIPQTRKRTFMISARYDNEEEKQALEKFFLNYNIKNYFKENPKELRKVDEFLKLDYSNEKYLKEAKEQTPNYTESRKKIRKENPSIVDENGVIGKMLRTLTTKQDRHPNSGIIYHDIDMENDRKATFRYLTPRESFLLMGFEESDFQALLDNNIETRRNIKLLSNTKLTKLAGNSIVVDVIEEVFRSIIMADEILKSL